MDRREAAAVRARVLACALRASAIIVLVSSLILPRASAFESSSASYRNKRSSSNQGGKAQSSATYRVGFTAGDVAFSTHTSVSFNTRDGFQTIAYYPGKVTGLFGSTGTLTTTIDLQWTAPGNDGYAAGTSAGRYDVRLSSIAAFSPAISDASYEAAASAFPLPPIPSNAGVTQAFTTSGLLEGVTYYIALKARERDGLAGVLSAGATVQTNGPFGCRIVKNVCKVGCDFSTIQSGVNAIPNPLIGHSCVLIRDSAVYPEAVTVQNFTMNGSSLTIARGPEVQGRPLVSPLGGPGFTLINSSINVVNLDIRPNLGSIPYGIFASSDYVKISSVNVDGPGLITTAGIAVSSWATISNSSFTVATGDAILVTGSSTTIAFSSGTAMSLGNGLHLAGSSRTVVTNGWFKSASSFGVLMDNRAALNVVSASTITSTGGLLPGLQITLASSNTVVNSYVLGSSATVVTGSTGTVLGGNFFQANAASGSGLWLTGGSVNLSLSSSVVQGGQQSAGVTLDAANSGAIYLSTNTFRPGSRFGLLAANQRPGTQLWVASNTIVASAISGQDDYGIYLNGLTSGATIYNNSVVFRTPASMGANTAYALFVQSGAALKINNNRFSNPGIITGGNYGGVTFSGTSNTTFNFNDVLSTGPSISTSFQLQLLAGTTAQVRNNIFLSSMVVTNSSATINLSANSGIDADYNDYYSSNTPVAFIWGAARALGLSAWQSLSGKDAASISFNPLWYNPSAGLEDFHPLSTGTGPGTGRCANAPICSLFVSDPTSSLTIDSADPTEAFANESAPNGSAANQGSYGNTIEASQSPPILSVTITPSLYDFGTVNMNLFTSTGSVSSATVTNNGTVTETFQVSAQVITGGSLLQLGQLPGIETVRLQALFNAAQPAAGAFDVVTSTITTAPLNSGNGTVNGNNYQGDQSGYAVPAQSKRAMWFKLTNPTSTIYNGVQQTIRVTVTAVP